MITRSPSPQRCPFRSRIATPAALLALALTVSPRLASAQTTGTSTVDVGSIALDQFDPSPPGDALWGVPSPSVGGHLIPRAMLMFDYAHHPLQLFSDSDTTVVSSQAFLRLDASLALWERLLVSLDMPFAVAQAGDEPGTPGVSYHVPSSAELGDLRLGARARLFGNDRDPFQAALGAYLFVPTGSDASYSSEGAVRGAPHAILGGRLSGPVDVVWSLSGGAVLRASDNPHTLTFGGGAAIVLGQDRAQIGPEIYGSVPLSDDSMVSVSGADVTSSTRVNAEVLLGGRVRLFEGLGIGAAGGPGLSTAVGTPAFRLIAMVAWSPEAPVEPARAREPDSDSDGIFDSADACPKTKGERSDDRLRNGCPRADRDGDGVLDVADACPVEAGPRSIDPTKNGCPPDRDEDGVADAKDACPDVKGSSSDDPSRSGCPNDRDGDGVLDIADACPYVKGEKNRDRARNGCPEDIDGDGMKPPEDACPFERGARDPDPTQNGCPKFVRVTATEIVILKPVRFITYGTTRAQTIDPVSDEVLAEVRDVINQHPEIKTIEVQGHTDEAGHPQFNEHLSQERAESVSWWLIEAGIPKEKLVAKGYGDTMPIADNRTFEGRQKNRRVQFIILEKQ